MDGVARGVDGSPSAVAPVKATDPKSVSHGFALFEVQVVGASAIHSAEAASGGRRRLDRENVQRPASNRTSWYDAAYQVDAGVRASPAASRYPSGGTMPSG